MNFDLIERNALKAIKELRKQKLSQGLSFMINSDILIPSQCFLAYPDGSIKIVEADKTTMDFQVVFELTDNDTNALRRKYKLAGM